MCVVETIEAIIKTIRGIENLAAISFSNLPTAKQVCLRKRHSADGTISYQGAADMKV